MSFINGTENPRVESAAVKMPAGTVTFETASGATFAVPLLTFTQELRVLADEYKAKDKDHFQFLEHVGRIIKERHNVDLTLDEIDWLRLQLEIEHAKKKHKQALDLKDTLNSLYSMGSTASRPEG